MNLNNNTALNLRPFFAILTILVIVIAAFSFTIHPESAKAPSGWCDKQLRPELKSLHEIKTSRPWFKVYDVGEHTYAIDEPYNYEETIAYLILGHDKALLFDTGMGLDSISKVVRELTKLPVVVLNSHTHPDHVGGNHEFNDIMAMNTAYTRENALNGYRHEQVRAEVTPAAFCMARLPHCDTARYYIKPFHVTKFIDDGHIIDLGMRKLQVIATPGHTPDAICLYDGQAGYLWCGDSFYQGPIFLFSEGTDLKAYGQSITNMAKFAAESNQVLPAHNLPVADPLWVVEAATDFTEIENGQKKGTLAENNTLIFDCGNFSFQIARRFLPQVSK